MRQWHERKRFFRTSEFEDPEPCRREQDRQSERRWESVFYIVSSREVLCISNRYRRPTCDFANRSLIMGTHTTPAGFRKISRRDKMFEERVHDPYKARHKIAEPSVCSQCGAVFHEGRW